MEQNKAVTNSDDMLKMLWIDDSAYYMGDICKGFIKRSNDIESSSGEGSVKKIKHDWWKLGDYYKDAWGTHGADDLTDDVKNFLEKKEDFKNNTDDNYVDKTVKKIKCYYNAVAIDLLLEKKDVEEFNEKSPGLPLSAKLFYKFTVGDSPIPCILYTSYGLDGGLDDIWKTAYQNAYGDIDINDQVIFDRNEMACKDAVDLIRKEVGG